MEKKNERGWWNRQSNLIKIDLMRQRWFTLYRIFFPLST